MTKIRAFFDKILIFALFFLLSAIVTDPLITRIGTGIYGYFPSDAQATIWSIWWIKQAWMHGISSMVCPLVASPFGIHFSISMEPLYEYSTRILAMFLNEVSVYNFQTLSSFLLSAITMYYLTLYLTRNRLASMVSGIIFAFSPYHLMRAMEHMILANIQWIPLYALSLLKLYEKRSYQYAIVAGFCFSLVILASLTYGYFALILTIHFALFGLIYGYLSQRRIVVDYRLWGKFILVILVGFLLTIPFNLSFIRTSTTEPQTVARPFSDLFNVSAKLSGYLLPSQDNPVLGHFVKDLVRHYGIEREQIVYLGYIPLLLAFFSVVAWRGRKRLQGLGAGQSGVEVTESLDGELASRLHFAIPFFVFLFLVALIWSAPPLIYWGKLAIPMPSFYMYRILPMFRSYARFAVVVVMSVSVLAGVGLKYLLEGSSFRSKLLITLLVMGLIFIEFTNIPPFRSIDLSASATPPVYRWLSSQPGDFTIVEYPFRESYDPLHYEYLLYQRVHQKRLINGASSGTRAWELTQHLRVISNGVPAVLRYLGAKYAIVHTDQYRDLQGDLLLMPGSGMKLTGTFEDSLVYEITAKPQQVLSREVKGFYGKGIWEDGVPRGWADNGSEVELVNFSNVKTRARLRFGVLAFAKPRTLLAVLNKKVIRRVEVPMNSTEVELEGLELRPGINTLTLWTPQGAQTIDSVAHNGDTSKVAFAFSEFEVE